MWVSVKLHELCMRTASKGVVCSLNVKNTNLAQWHFFTLSPCVWQVFVIVSHFWLYTFIRIMCFHFLCNNKNNNNNYYYFREYVFERKRASLNTFYGHIYLCWFFPATCKEERTSYDDANRQGIFFILKLNWTTVVML